MKNLIYNIVKKENARKIAETRLRKTLPPFLLKEIQEYKFLKLINHVKNYSPYYANLINNKNFSCLNDITNLPILSKQLIKKHFKDIKSTLSQDVKHLKKNSTSGSTGESTYFYCDLRDNNEVRAIRGDEFVPNFIFLEKQLIFWGAERDIVSKKIYVITLINT